MKIYSEHNEKGHIEVYCSECEERALVVEMGAAEYYEENPVYCLKCLKKAVELLEGEIIDREAQNV